MIVPRAAALVLVLAVIADGAESHLYPAPLGILGGPSTLDGEAADLDGDGAPDLVLAMVGGVRVALGDGLGGLVPTAYIPLTDSPWDVELADFDGDGRLDLAASEYQAFSGQLTFADGVPGGGFGTPHSVPTAKPLREIEVADLNGDGRLDVVGTCAQTNALVLVGNQGSGVFHPTLYATLLAPGVFVLGDLDGDARPDAAVAAHGGARLAVVLNQIPATTPIGGGCTLLVAPPPVLTVPFVTTGFDPTLFTFDPPPPLPPLKLFVQAFLAEPGRPSGFVATNAVGITYP